MKRTFITAIIALFPGIVLANGHFNTAPGPESSSGSSENEGELGNPLAVDSIQDFIAEILTLVAQIALPLVVLALVYTGFLFVTAQGNEEKLNKAKTALFWTVVGALVVLGASVLAEAIEGTVEQLREPISMLWM